MSEFIESVVLGGKGQGIVGTHRLDSQEHRIRISTASRPKLPTGNSGLRTALSVTGDSTGIVGLPIPPSDGAHPHGPSGHHHRACERRALPTIRGVPQTRPPTLFDQRKPLRS